MRQAGSTGSRARSLRLIAVGVAATVVVVVVLATVLAARFSAENGSTATATGSEIERIAGSGLERAPLSVGFRLVRREAPEFRETGLSPGTSVDLARFRGRPVVVNFWQSACAPCRAEMPAIAAVARTLRTKVAFIGVDTLDDRAAARAFAAAHGATYPIAYDPEDSVGARYGVAALPTTFFVSASGRRILAVNLGAMSSTSLSADLRRAFGPGL